MMFFVVILSAVAMASASWDAGLSHGWAPAPAHGGIHKYGPAPLAHDGKVIDTADVAHAKAEHFAAHAKAAAAAHSSHGAWGAHAWAPAPAAHWAPAPEAHAWAPAHDSWAPKWHGPIAHIELTHDGQYVKDTPEVAHARAQHLSALAAAHHASADHYSHAQPDYGHGHGHW